MKYIIKFERKCKGKYKNKDIFYLIDNPLISDNRCVTSNNIYAGYEFKLFDARLIVSLFLQRFIHFNHTDFNIKIEKCPIY